MKKGLSPEFLAALGFAERKYGQLEQLKNTRETVTDPQKITEILSRSASKFNTLMSAKARAGNFNTTFDAMISNLGLDTIERVQAMEQLDKLFIDVDGIKKTADGYETTDLKAMRQSVGTEGLKRRILRFLSEKEFYGVNQIVKETGFARTTVETVLQKLNEEGHITSEVSKVRGNNVTRYKKS
jgi:DeoR/GlpR family transcriptional regulator of sugar metabolism